MTRRRFLATLLVFPFVLSLGAALRGAGSSWQFSHHKRTGFHGIFFTKGNKCLALYKDRQGRALTYWSDITKQKLPWAVGFPYGGEYLLQSSVWKS